MTLRMRSFRRVIRRFGAGQRGAAVAEYVVLLGLLAVLVLASIIVLGGGVQRAYRSFAGAMPTGEGQTQAYQLGGSSAHPVQVTSDSAHAESGGILAVK